MGIDLAQSKGVESEYSLNRNIKPKNKMNNTPITTETPTVAVAELIGPPAPAETQKAERQKTVSWQGKTLAITRAKTSASLTLTPQSSLRKSSPTYPGVEEKETTIQQIRDWFSKGDEKETEFRMFVVDSFNDLMLDTWRQYEDEGKFIKSLAEDIGRMPKSMSAHWDRLRKAKLSELTDLKKTPKSNGVWSAETQDKIDVLKTEIMDLGEKYNNAIMEEMDAEN